MPRSILLRPGFVVAALAAAFLVALVMPIPALPDAGRADVRAEVRDRLPGWTVQRLDPSWEGAYTVVTTCAGREVSFQFVPGHGLPQEDAWIQPNNDYARTRLEATSDHFRYLVWRDGQLDPSSVSCADELARSGDANGGDPNID